MNQETIVPVSALITRVRTFLESHVNIDTVWIEGEISNLTKHRSGHYYFSLKDEKGAMSCVMFAGYVSHLKFDVEDGMKVQVKAKVSVYEQRGSLQLYVKQMRPNGLGSLYLEFEKRKAELLKAGYFDQAHKKGKPSYMEDIAIITAKEGAALQDALRTIQKRWPMTRVTLYPALVQGIQAPSTIIKQIKYADTMGHDAILVIRGGGSYEDLFCFNDVELVKAVYNTETYIVSGVGHEVDTSLCDLAADHRSLTPTDAAAWVTWDQKEVHRILMDRKAQMSTKMTSQLQMYRNHLSLIQKNPYIQEPKSWIFEKQVHLDQNFTAMEHQMEKILSQKETISKFHTDLVQAMRHTIDIHRIQNANNVQLLNRLSKSFNNELTIELKNHRANLQSAIVLYDESMRKKLMEKAGLLDAYSPLKVLSRGYSIVYNDEHIVKNINDVQKDDPIRVRVNDGMIHAVVQKKENNNGGKEN